MTGTIIYTITNIDRYEAHLQNYYHDGGPDNVRGGCRCADSPWRRRGGGGLEPLDRETVITDLSSPAGSGNLFVSISVDCPDGSDSTYYYVTSSYEAACEAAGIKLSELTNMMQFTDEGYIRSYLEHFLGRFPKIDLWISLSATKE